MAFTSFTNTVKVVIGQLLDGDLAFSNTLWFDRPGYTYNEQAQFAQTIFDSWVARLIPHQVEEVELVQVQVYNMQSPSAPVATYAPTPVRGLLLDPPYALNSALVITFRTQDRGRSARGRMFFGGLTEMQVDNGEINVTASADILAGVAGLQLDASTAGWTHVIAQQFLNGERLLQGISRPVIQAEVRSRRVGTMGRRVDRP